MKNGDQLKYFISALMKDVREVDNSCVLARCVRCGDEMTIFSESLECACSTCGRYSLIDAVATMLHVDRQRAELLLRKLNLVKSMSPFLKIAEKLSISDASNQKIEYLIDNLLPCKSLTLLTAHYGSGKSLFALHVAKKLIENNHTVVYIDNDNPHVVVSERLELFKLNSKLKHQLFYIMHVTKDSKEYQELHNELMKTDHHCIIIFDTLTDFAINYDLNNDFDASKVMKTFKELRNKHTVIILHHKPKDLSQKFKNSTRIVDSVDVAYEVFLDKFTKTFHLNAFKTRIQVKENHVIPLDID